MRRWRKATAFLLSAILSMPLQTVFAAPGIGNAGTENESVLEAELQDSSVEDVEEEDGFKKISGQKGTADGASEKAQELTEDESEEESFDEAESQDEEISEEDEVNEADVSEETDGQDETGESFLDETDESSSDEFEAMNDTGASEEGTGQESVGESDMQDSGSVEDDAFIENAAGDDLAEGTSDTDGNIENDTSHKTDESPFVEETEIQDGTGNPVESESSNGEDVKEPAASDVSEEESEDVKDFDETVYSSEEGGESLPEEDALEGSHAADEAVNMLENGEDALFSEVDADPETSNDGAADDAAEADDAELVDSGADEAALAEEYVNDNSAGDTVSGVDESDAEETEEAAVLAEDEKEAVETEVAEGNADDVLEAGDAEESKEAGGEDSETESGKEDLLTDHEVSEETETGTEASGNAETTAEDFEAEGELLEQAAEDALSDKENEVLFSFNTGWDGASYIDKGDGNYEILVEQNPLFPYEIQFSVDGAEETKWFEEPSESFEVGGYNVTLAVSEDEYTRLSVDILGETVYLDPAEKDFAEDTKVDVLLYPKDSAGDLEANGRLRLDASEKTDGQTTYMDIPEVSHQHVKEQRLEEVDLRHFTPADLTSVTLSSLFPDTVELKDMSIAWTKESDSLEQVTVSKKGSKLDLSYGTSYNNTIYWIMKVGPKTDQLASDEDYTLYKIPVRVTSSSRWLEPIVYSETDGKRKGVNVTSSSYDDGSYRGDREFSYWLSTRNLGKKGSYRLAFEINEDWLENATTSRDLRTDLDKVKFYEGKYSSPKKAAEGKDITKKIWKQDMTKAKAGYALKYDSEDTEKKYVTMVTYDKDGNATGCLPILLDAKQSSSYFYPVISNQSYKKVGVGENLTEEGSTDGVIRYRMNLFDGFTADSTYYLSMEDHHTSVPISQAYVGKYKSVKAAKKAGAIDIKDSLLSENGYALNLKSGKYITIFTGGIKKYKDVSHTDKNGKTVIKSEPVKYFDEAYHFYVRVKETAATGYSFSMHPLYAIVDNAGVTDNRDRVEKVSKTPEREELKEGEEEDPWEHYVATIQDSWYPANGTYYFSMGYDKMGDSSLDTVTAAYAGRYESIAEAKKAKAKNIKFSLLSNSADGGYAADYSKGVDFTIFIGEDGDGQEIFRYNIRAEGEEEDLNSGDAVTFHGLLDEDGYIIDSYRIDTKNADSYGDENFRVFLVGEDVNLKKITPVYTTSAGVHLYVNGKLQENEKYEKNSSYIKGFSHNFSKGPVKFTAGSEDGNFQMNYWLYVVKASEENRLFINSFYDDGDGENGQNYKIEKGVVYSTREIILDSNHDEYHDILIINRDAKNPIEKLTAELKSDQLVLDKYWRLDEETDLEAFSTLEEDYNYPHAALSNLAKIRIRKKGNVKDGTELSGTLTIKSNGKKIAELTLTGTVGTPVITTKKKLPDGVLYVPYGTMIQNSNKYERNNPTYTLSEDSGPLPKGMEIRPNGEVYGVPLETGTFKFKVRMTNSYPRDTFDEKEFTLKIRKNTDPNVDEYAIIGYEDYRLTKRIPDINAFTAENEYLMISLGEYKEFTAGKYNIFLDGVKLVRNTDYTSESGSTRVTIKTQTLTKNGNGTHTIGVEFRHGGEKEFRRTSQNYDVTNKRNSNPSKPSSSGGGGGGGGGGGSSSSGSKAVAGQNLGGGSPIASSNAAATATNAVGGVPADQAAAGGNMADGRLPGRAFAGDRPDTPGHWAQRGNSWVFKNPYDESINWTGWIIVGHYWYYMNPNGSLATGWKAIDGKWYYFNEAMDNTRGMLFADTTTPDGYRVLADGSWDGQRHEGAAASAASADDTAAAASQAEGGAANAASSGNTAGPWSSVSAQARAGINTSGN